MGKDEIHDSQRQQDFFISLTSLGIKVSKHHKMPLPKKIKKCISVTTNQACKIRLKHIFDLVKDGHTISLENHRSNMFCVVHHRRNVGNFFRRVEEMGFSAKSIKERLGSPCENDKSFPKAAFVLSKRYSQFLICYLQQMPNYRKEKNKEILSSPPPHFSLLPLNSESFNFN